ncbi:hypothetical protein [Sulfurimonas sp.]|uniref:hypothetical protein n=1 Tax=Sulfurimonas sp. TaxID=2022749 RepID=UPI003D0CBBCC
MEITQEQYAILKENYQFAQEIKELQIPLTKQEITHLRKLVKQHIKEGYTNYLRLITIYSMDRDKLLGIFVRDLYNALLLQK